MTVGIVGLGLIGGSFAKAYKKSGHTVYSFDADKKMLDFAILSGAVDRELTFENIKECQLVLLCVYPDDAVEYLSAAAKYISKETFIIDCCGIKAKVCKACFEIAKKHGFTFVGGHPMAGTQYSGFKYSKASLFKGAYMVLVPPKYDNMAFLEEIKELLEPAQFAHFSVINAEEHDRIIAFTSQLAHIVSNAYVKSPTARIHKGFSAGSYKDLTRVAWLNEVMWSQLCMENKENIVFELSNIISSLEKYKKALEEDNIQELKELFYEGKKIKHEIDG
ncbi:MAG: prephenate dehydrogenase [Ruminococcaceae bacterium]|nr:prephenate dehydrogenase [Oscillospiraceae bacterium]